MRTVLAITLALAVAPILSAQSTSNDFVGSTICGTCHRNVGSDFYKNPHFKSIALGKKPPAETGCEGCHGPGGNHVRAGGGRATIRAFSALSANGVLEACLNCHAESIPRANIRSSQHITNGLSCTSCHSIHKPQSSTALLQKPQIELCSSCHRAVQAQFSLPFKHRVQEGFMSCTDCHNPHGTASPTWTTAATSRLVTPGKANEQPCVNCHNEMRGPYVFEHPGVRVEGCQGCHVPHGSNNSRLLKRPVVFPLCLECHNGAGNFGRQGDGIRTQTPRHNLTDPLYQNCTTCHVRIHGSNADSRYLR